MDHKFQFSEGVSLAITCKSQAEIDYYWDSLTEDADPAAQQCGWLKDKFGVSWQVVPEILYKLVNDTDKATAEKVTNAFLKMKKFDLAALRRAYEGALTTAG